MSPVQGTRKLNENMLEILAILDGIEGPATSGEIQRELNRRGIYLSQRTIRYYLKLMDELGLTRKVRKARQITSEGRRRMRALTVSTRMEWMLDRMYQRIAEMDFDLATGSGSVIANKLFLRREDFTWVMQHVISLGKEVPKLLFYPRYQVRETGLRRGDLLEIKYVSSNTLYGILLRNGVPVSVKGVGLLELKNYRPTTFVEVMHYSGTTISPSQLLIFAGMTRVSEAAKRGTGTVLATFGEIPYNSISKAQKILDKMRELGFEGIMEIREPGFAYGLRTGKLRGVVISVTGANFAAMIKEGGFDLRMAFDTAMDDLEAFDRNVIPV